LAACGPPRRRATTLPAHTALFNGNLPAIAGKLLGRYDQLWRSSQAGPTTAEVAVTFTGRTFLDDYARRGFTVVGAGGVGFFHDSPDNLLPQLFPAFAHYHWARDRGLDQRLALRAEELPLAHPDALVGLLGDADRFVLFVNCPVTHLPYAPPGAQLTDTFLRALHKTIDAHRSKRHHSPYALPLDPAETAAVRAMQVAAVEWADHALGRLLSLLVDRGPLLVVVCGDHGEEFGEGGRYGHAHNHPTVLQVPLWAGLVRRSALLHPGYAAPATAPLDV
jgi:hypothetical protein